MRVPAVWLAIGLVLALALLAVIAALLLDRRPGGGDYHP